MVMCVDKTNSIDNVECNHLTIVIALFNKSVRGKI